MMAGLRSEVIKKILKENNTFNCSLEFDLNQEDAYGFDMNPDEPSYEFDEKPMYYEDVVGQQTLDIIIEIIQEIIEEKTDASS